MNSYEYEAKLMAAKELFQQFQESIEELSFSEDFKKAIQTIESEINTDLEDF